MGARRLVIGLFPARPAPMGKTRSGMGPICGVCSGPDPPPPLSSSPPSLSASLRPAARDTRGRSSGRWRGRSGRPPGRPKPRRGSHDRIVDLQLQSVSANRFGCGRHPVGPGIQSIRHLLVDVLPGRRKRWGEKVGRKAGRNRSLFGRRRTADRLIQKWEFHHQNNSAAQRLI